MMEPNGAYDPSRLVQDPAIYLRQQPEPTSPCHILVEQLNSHDGDSVPMHMLAKVAVRLYGLFAWTLRWDARERFLRRITKVAAGVAIANIAAVVSYWLHAHDARIIAETEARASKEAEIEYRKAAKETDGQLQREIDQLRNALLKLGVIDPKSVTIVRNP